MYLSPITLAIKFGESGSKLTPWKVSTKLGLISESTTPTNGEPAILSWSTLLTTTVNEPYSEPGTEPAGLISCIPILNS